jgi:NADPH2:quinone reductase
MKAVTIERTPEGARYVLTDVPEPDTGPDDLLVAVHASAINQADLRYAAAHFAASEPGSGPARGQAAGPGIGGLELAGEVIALGERVTGFAVGDRVMAMTGRAWPCPFRPGSAGGTRRPPRSPTSPRTTA